MATSARSPARELVTASAAEAEAKEAPWPPPRLGLWKSRLPLVVMPLLAGLRRLAPAPGRGPGFGSAPSGEWWWCEAAFLAAVSAATGFAGLPFSATWWCVLLAAFAVRTQLLVGAATVLSLSILLGWYGTRLCHPQAVSALWGGSRNAAAGAGGPWALVYWKAWDLCAHFVPAVLVLYWHGPSFGLRGAPPCKGTVTLSATLVALPLNVFWIWGLGLGRGCRQLPAGARTGAQLAARPRQRPPSSAPAASAALRLWPWGFSLADTDLVYRVTPGLPKGAWHWVYGCHWALCGLWAAALVLPLEVLLAYAVFSIYGLMWWPFTHAWWTLFLLVTFEPGRWPVLEGLVWCCAATTAVGFYGAQILVPSLFPALVRAWVLKPVDRWAPRWFADLVHVLWGKPIFWVLLRLADFCFHLLPTTYAFYALRRNAVPAPVLAALPTNVLWLIATGACRMEDANQVYGIDPPPPQYLWRFSFGSHFVFCLGAACGLARAW